MLTSKDALLLVSLIEQGVCANSPSLEVLQPLGLWHLTENHQSLVASRKLIELHQSLPSCNDTVAAVLATQVEYQTAWSKVVAAQLKDAGSRKDENALIDQISQLESAATSVLNQLNHASLQATGFAKVESLLLGQSAQQSASYPKLLRALAVAASIKQDSGCVDKLSYIDRVNTSSAWHVNRLIQIPFGESLTELAVHYLLTGNIMPLDPDGRQSLAWLQAHPWAYLLAHVAYAQDIWRSEQIAGSLRLEIEQAQAKYFMRPGKIQVIVTTRDDVEVSCGSLAELLLRVLDSLKISLFTELTAEQQVIKLDAAIGPVIGYMVEAKVWQFIQGSSQDIPHYQIHPQFEPVPNTRLGTIGFARPGQHITAAIREQAEHWAMELSGRKGGRR
tara:strand:- start:18658 stop:19827 length:1170 start_codon:yes stop_codon:yes gene_type:complete